jgi:hypothetical protein
MPTSRVLVPLLLCLLAIGRPSLADEAPVVLADPASGRADAEPVATLAPVAPPPRWSASGASDEVGGYRLSLSRGSLDMAMRFEPRVSAAHPIDARYDSAAPIGVSLPSLYFGLRSVAAGPAPAGSLVERVLGAGATDNEVKKIGIAWKPAQSRLFFNRGVGFRLSGEDRVVMRLRGGSIGIYMHRKF